MLLFAAILLGSCCRGAGGTTDRGNHNADWGDGRASWDEFGHDNDPDVCGLPMLTVDEWEAGRHWEGNRPVLVRNVTDGWAARKHWTLREMLRRYPDAEATMGDARLISEAGPKAWERILIPTTIKEFITKHMYDPSRYFFDRRIGIPKEMVEDCHPFPMPTRAFFERRDARYRWRDHLTISIGADGQGLTFHEHGEAWNAVVFGTKRWILWERTSLNATMQRRMVYDEVTRRRIPAHDWVGTLRENQWRMREIRANGHDCVQRAGEMMFVPEGCRHMVVNIGDTVAVVSEADIDGGGAEGLEDVAPDLSAPSDRGSDLLDELLQEEASSVRANLLRHYLCPRETGVGRNGETIDLVGEVLVSHRELAKALSGAFAEIYELEEAGEFDRAQAMRWVKNVRVVASEARMVLVECLGKDSDAANEMRRVMRNSFGECDNVDIRIV